MENLQDYYVSASVIITKAPGLYGGNTRQVLLEPKETKIVPFILETPSNIDEGFIYTSTLEATTSFGGIATSQIKYSQEYDSMSLESARRIVDSLKEREEKTTFPNLHLECTPDKPVYYSTETAKIECKLSNKNVASYKLNVCIKESCTLVNAKSNQLTFFDLTAQVTDKGRIPVIIENNNNILTAYVDFNVIKKAEIYVTDISPSKINYKDLVDFSFTLNSDTSISNVFIDFGFDTLAMDNFQGAKEINIQTRGSSLYKGFPFHATYTDEAGKQYTQDEILTLQVENTPFYAVITWWFIDLFS